MKTNSQAIFTLVWIRTLRVVDSTFLKVGYRHHPSSTTMNVPGVGTGARPMGIMGGPPATSPEQIQEQQMIKTVRANPNPISKPY